MEDKIENDALSQQYYNACSNRIQKGLGINTTGLPLNTYRYCK